MDLTEEIAKMNFYKTFRLREGAPEEAKQALAKWIAMKMKSRLF